MFTHLGATNGLADGTALGHRALGDAHGRGLLQQKVDMLGALTRLRLEGGSHLKIPKYHVLFVANKIL